MDDPCDVCGQTEYTVEAGFYYCAECGTKSQHHGQELVAEDVANLPSQGAALIRLKKYKKCKQITSWEQANYVLLGFTDRLISLGAGEGLKLTVLQLWTTYLRRMEIAFFDKTKPEKPRLHAFYKKIDADIIYNRRRKPVKRIKNREKPSISSKALSDDGATTVTTKSTVSRLSILRKARANLRRLMNVEYDSFAESQRSDLNSSLHDLSVRSLNASKSGESDASEGKGQNIRFSRLARVKMKRRLKMSSAHIRRHEQDVDEQLQCHRAKRLDPKMEKTENITRMLLSGFLALGLNVSKSDVQLADLARFHREEHLPYNSLIQYLPEALDPSCYRETINALQQPGLPVGHSELRIKAMHLAKFLNVQPVSPDLLKLCRRYLEELCLPMDLLVYIERVMIVFPPKMKSDSITHLPNYECRAMSFIIFVLKLLFGLNGTTEMKMSKSAAKLNRTLSNVGLFDTSVFVFTEWVRYLEMRRVILGQVNYAINRQMAKEERIDLDADIFIDHTTRKKRSVDSCRDTNFRQKQLISKMKDVITNLVDTHHRHGSSRECRSSIEFEPSLTPYKSYLERFLLAYNKDEKIHIPNFMRVDHTSRIISVFVDPSDLHYLLLTNHQIRLTTKKVAGAINLMKFTDTVPVHIFLSAQLQHQSPFMYAENCEESDWNPPMKPVPRKAKTHENILDSILIRNEIERQKTDQIRQLHKQQEPSYSDQCENSATTEESFSTFSAEMFSQESDEIAPNQAAEKTKQKSPPLSSVHLLTPSYDYWVRFYGRGEAYSLETFEEHVAVGFSENFRLVLEECARVVENRPAQLYHELMALEAYFFYAVQPVERFFRGDQSPVDVLYENVGNSINSNDQRAFHAKQYY
ncbi:TATA box-binding protein-associated factor RNA polymerase I subunit B [Topomyia yanbarensis]|uniref:TATA box-binding protein-associated factor RNA polymerase I subunit B n=1 Tax=Topomyia yanbarensis TaxID=2498891 RepID=UPI00273AC539|nr:TATA box-binding protein-associated factor RNA polymerase I subunit B [Topomyia yanbarensis]